LAEVVIKLRICRLIQHVSDLRRKSVTILSCRVQFSRAAVDARVAIGHAKAIREIKVRSIAPRIYRLYGIARLIKLRVGGNRAGDRAIHQEIMRACGAVATPGVGSRESRIEPADAG